MTTSVNSNKTGIIAAAKDVARLPNAVNLTATPWRGTPISTPFWPDSTWTNVYGLNTRKSYIANRAAAFVRLVYANLASFNDAATTDMMTVRAAIEASNGATRQRVFFNGQIDGRVSPGGILVSDPVPAKLASQQNFFVWTYASGKNLPYMNASTQPTNSSWGEGCDAATNTALSDKTLSGSVTANSVSHISPIAVIADASVSLPIVGHFGDSIAAGLGDVASPITAGPGFLRRAMGTTIPCVSLALSGDNIVSRTHPVRFGLAQGCTDVIDEIGINDVNTGASLAALQAAVISSWQSLGAFGARVWRTTLMPLTTSTDNWATLANQTVTANEPVRTGFNDWIRDGAPVTSAANLTAVAVGTSGALRAGGSGHPLSGYFEVADTVESARNSGKWIVGSVYTGDSQGIHPNSTGAAAAALAIDTTRFTA